MEFRCFSCQENFEYADFKGYESLVLHNVSERCPNCGSFSAEPKQYAKKTKIKDVIEIQFDFGDKGFVNSKGKIYSRGYRYLAYENTDSFGNTILAQKISNGIVYNGIINFEGKEIVPFVPMEEIYYYLLGFKDGVCGYEKANGEKGFINAEGKVISEWNGEEITRGRQSFKNISSFYTTREFYFDGRKLTVQERALEELAIKQQDYLNPTELHSLLNRIK